MSALDKFFRHLSRVHPIYYIIIYLLVIPAFGFLYTHASSHGFYAPYSRYEPAASQDLADLALIIEREIKRLSHYDYREDTHQAQISSGEPVVFLNEMTVNNITSVDGTSIRFRVAFPLAALDRRATANDFNRVLFRVFQDFAIDDYPMMRLRDDAGVYTLRELHFIQTPDDLKWGPHYDPTNIFVELLKPSVVNCKLLSSCTIFVAYSEDEEIIQNYLKGVKGDPFAVSGQFPRMLYLSAVIITTLGLGDIVPISTLARSLVATEAVVGIIIAGLFLNAVAFRAAHPDHEGSSTTAAKRALGG